MASVLPAAGDGNDFAWPVMQLGLEIIEQQVDAAIRSDNARQRFEDERLHRSEHAASTRSIHSHQRSASGKSTSSRTNRTSFSDAPVRLRETLLACLPIIARRSERKCERYDAYIGAKIERLMGSEGGLVVAGSSSDMRFDSHVRGCVTCRKPPFDGGRGSRQGRMGDRPFRSSSPHPDRPSFDGLYLTSFSETRTNFAKGSR